MSSSEYLKFVQGHFERILASFEAISKFPKSVRFKVVRRLLWLV